MTKEIGLRIILFVSFFMVMLVSVTHVAWVFAQTDHTDTTSWAVVQSYMCAIAIDIAIASISLFMTASKKLTNKVTGYLFVCGLAGLSWFANWLYAKEHMSTTGIFSHTITLMSLFSFDLSKVTPIVFGSMPVLVIAFSIMIDHLTGSQIDATELEKVLSEKAAVEKVRNQYKGESVFKKATKVASEMRTVVEAIRTGSTEQNELTELVVESTPNTEQETEPLNVIQFTGSTLKEQVMNLLEQRPKIKNQEIVNELGVSKSHVSSIRSQFEKKEKVL